MYLFWIWYNVQILIISFWNKSNPLGIKKCFHILKTNFFVGIGCIMHRVKNIL